MENDIYMEITDREKRYQWTIKVLLIVVFFLAGVFFESERMKAQVVTNTVELRLLKESLRDIQEKLNLLLENRSIIKR
ncbi:hypothetical protein ACFL6H_04860 [Candidatus Latescibacterota bacterium]